MAVLMLTALLFAQDKDWEKFQELGQEIEIIQLIRGLELEPDQLERLVEIGKEWEQGLEEIFDENKDSIEAGVKLRKQFKKKLLRGEEITDEERQSLEEVGGELRQVWQRQMESRGRTVDAIREVLTEEQLSKLTRRRGRGPETQIRRAIGQVLQQSRRIPEEAYEEQFYDMVRGRLQGIVARGGDVSEEELDDEVDRVFGVLDDARDLEDDQFAEKREELETRIVGEGKVGEAVEKMGGRGGDEGRRRESDRILGETFLNPKVIEILEDLQRREEKDDE